MTKKKFIKKLMAVGISRDVALIFTNNVLYCDGNYKDYYNTVRKLTDGCKKGKGNKGFKEYIQKKDK